MNRLQAEIDELSGLSSHPAPAVTRVLFSPEDLEARKWLTAKFEAEGLEVRQDAVGNLFARWEGSDPSLPAVATGSHTDAIPNAGKFDGVVGVLGGLEAVRRLKKSGFTPKRAIEIIMFTAEEPTRFGLGCLGSRLLAGAIDPLHAEALKDSEGTTLEILRNDAGCEGALESVRLDKDHYSAFVELHIEQGPWLERDGVAIGVVGKNCGAGGVSCAAHGRGRTCRGGAHARPPGCRTGRCGNRARRGKRGEGGGKPGYRGNDGGFSHRAGSDQQRARALSPRDRSSRYGHRRARLRGGGDSRCGGRNLRPEEHRVRVFGDQFRSAGGLRCRTRGVRGIRGEGAWAVESKNDQPRLPRFALHGACLSDGDDLHSVPEWLESSAGRIFFAGSDRRRRERPGCNLARAGELTGIPDASHIGWLHASVSPVH